MLFFYAQKYKFILVILLGYRFFDRIYRIYMLCFFIDRITEFTNFSDKILKIKHTS